MGQIDVSPETARALGQTVDQLSQIQDNTDAYGTTIGTFVTQAQAAIKGGVTQPLTDWTKNLTDALNRTLAGIKDSITHFIIAIVAIGVGVFYFTRKEKIKASLAVLLGVTLFIYIAYEWITSSSTTATTDNPGTTGTISDSKQDFTPGIGYTDNLGVYPVPAPTDPAPPGMLQNDSYNYGNGTGDISDGLVNT